MGSTRLSIKLSYRFFSSSLNSRTDFSHVVIGGGVVGTAIASEFQQLEGSCVAILEQHERLGMETTSRNSEVIHAGLYYPQDSLKAKLCIRGKQLIYSKLDPAIVPYSKCGKWVVAQNENEAQYLEKLYKNSQALDTPVRMVSVSEAQRTFPQIRAKFGALESPTTGIVSAHDLTGYFQAQFENHSGTIALNTVVKDLHYEPHTKVYSIDCLDKTSGDQFQITSENVINSAGLHAQRIANLLLPKDRHFRSYFAKGNYFTYSRSSGGNSNTHKSAGMNPTGPITSKLIYPCPQANASGLGTHLTFDLAGQIRFGPDLEWIDESVQDASVLNYDVSSENLEKARDAIATYFPSIRLEDLQPSYSGIRPKVCSEAQSKVKFSDFYIKQEDGFPGFVNLIGIESPGLTSSFAIAEFVRGIFEG